MTSAPAQPGRSKYTGLDPGYEQVEQVRACRPGASVVLRQPQTDREGAAFPDRYWGAATLAALSRPHASRPGLPSDSIRWQVNAAYAVTGVVADLRLNPVGGEADPAGPTNRALCVAGGCAAGRRCGRAAGMHPASEELNK